MPYLLIEVEYLVFLGKIIHSSLRNSSRYIGNWFNLREEKFALLCNDKLHLKKAHYIHCTQ